MWGAGAASIEDPPQSDPEKFAGYQEKQVIYQRDLQELPAEQRLEKIKEFRKEYFSTDQIARLEQVDAELEADKKKEADYYAQAKAIMNNPGIADDKKEEALRELQDNTFGEEAEAFRRRLNIEKNTK
jgi:lipase chaperone LimK